MSSRTSTEGRVATSHPAAAGLIAALAALIFLGVAPSARAEIEPVSICFNYGCHDRQAIELNGTDLAPLRSRFDAVTDAASEREAIGAAVAEMYRLAAGQSPIWRDRGGNFADDDTKHGRMDCIDHSTNTTTFLRVIERLGWLRFHAVGERAERGHFLSVHWTATVRDREGGEAYAVDTWFYDPGQLPVMYTLRDWLRGKRPPGTSILSTSWTQGWAP